jgi:hypothetical protein
MLCFRRQQTHTCAHALHARRGRKRKSRKAGGAEGGGGGGGGRRLVDPTMHPNMPVMMMDVALCVTPLLVNIDCGKH